MGKSGPPPKPTALRRLQGNPGKRAYPDQEPQPPTSLETYTQVPEELAGNARAVLEWNRLAPMLHKVRVLTDADRSALIAVCLEWSRYVDASAKVASLGLIVKAPSGYPMQNPYLAIANKALQLSSRLWQELGLTPAARTRVREAAPGDDPGVTDAFTEFDEPLKSVQ